LKIRLFVIAWDPEKLSADPEIQKELMQEMFVHLVRIQTAEVGQSLSGTSRAVNFTRATFSSLDAASIPRSARARRVADEATGTRETAPSVHRNPG